MRITGFENSIAGSIRGIESDAGPKTKFNPAVKPVTGDFLVEEDGDVIITLRSPDYPRGIRIELNNSGGEFRVLARTFRMALLESAKEIRAEQNSPHPVEE